MATRVQHADAIILACNGIPNDTIRAAIVGWSMQETGGTPRPQNNMLACGLKQPGSTDFNSIVQNYPTMGLEGTAIAQNLSENFAGYAELKKAIAGGYWDSSVQQGLITWVGHDAYGSKWASFVRDGQAHLNDDYDSGVVSPDTSNGSGSNDPISQLAQVLVELAKPLFNAGNVLQALSNISQNPIRIVKFLVGLGVLGVGLLMVLVDVFETVNNSQPAQAIKKTGAAAAKLAAM